MSAVKEKKVYPDDFFESHTDVIYCPECNRKQMAKVFHTIPWATFIHHCMFCQYTIQESEWNKVSESELKLA